MNCEKFNEMLDNYESLTEEEKLMMTEHTASCAKCREELDFMLKIISTTKSLPKIEPPDDFISKINSKIDSQIHVKKYDWKKYASIAACAALVAVIGFNAQNLTDTMLNKDDSGVISKTTITDDNSSDSGDNSFERFNYSEEEPVSTIKPENTETPSNKEDNRREETKPNISEKPSSKSSAETPKTQSKKKPASTQKPVSTQKPTATKKPLSASSPTSKPKKSEEISNQQYNTVTYQDTVEVVIENEKEIVTTGDPITFESDNNSNNSTDPKQSPDKIKSIDAPETANIDYELSDEAGISSYAVSDENTVSGHYSIPDATYSIPTVEKPNTLNDIQNNELSIESYSISKLKGSEFAQNGFMTSKSSNKIYTTTECAEKLQEIIDKYSISNDGITYEIDTEKINELFNELDSEGIHYENIILSDMGNVVSFEIVVE